MDLLTSLRRALATEQLTGRFERLLVAFSAGPDSTALLGGLAALADELRLEVHAAHLDHALDPDSGRRARAAQSLCREASIPCHVECRPVRELRHAGESLEAGARRIRYRFLEQTRARIGAIRILTAHHRRDQIETVLLRLLQGSGLAGLAGICPRLGKVWRPLLDVAPEDLARFIGETDLVPVQDPTNFDLSIPRARVRHLLLPHLLESDSTTGDRLLAISKAAAGARSALERRLRVLLEPDIDDGAVLVERQRLLDVPQALTPPAIALLHRDAGLIYPPQQAAVLDLFRQLRRGGRVGCDIGGGWRWESEGSSLRLSPAAAPTPAFAYTLEIPGEVEIPEVSARFRLQRERVEAWMFESSPTAAGLSLPLEDGSEVIVRNRRPGDRIRPLGCDYSRKLKEVLIDRRVPRRKRDSLPLLIVNGRVAWVPGVTLDEAFRVEPGNTAWAARLEYL